MKIALIALIALIEILLAWPPRASAAIHFTGHVEGTWVLVAMQREVASQFLPAALGLAYSSEIGNQFHKDQYPILFFFATHSNAHPAGAPDAFGMNYDEFVFEVPFVHVRNSSSQTSFGFMAKLYLNQFLPIFYGQALYHFPKYRGVINKSPTQYEVSSKKQNQKYLRADFDFEPGAEFRSSSSFPKTAFAQRIMNLPMIAVDKKGQLSCSLFDWNFKNSLILPVRSKVKAEHAFISGFPSPALFENIPGIDEAELGSFKIRTDWKFSLPMSCQGY